MADFCKQCSIENFGEDSKDLANIGTVANLEKDYGWTALCEGCGMTIVDNQGRCISKHCDKRHGNE